MDTAFELLANDFANAEQIVVVNSLDNELDPDYSGIALYMRLDSKGGYTKRILKLPLAWQLDRRRAHL